MHTFRVHFLCSNFCKKSKKRPEHIDFHGIIKPPLNTILNSKIATGGGRCFILGNGPSIKEMDILKLKDEQTFVVNTFWNHPQCKELDPTYYTVVDEEIFSDQETNNNYFLSDVIAHNKIASGHTTKFFFHIAGKELIEGKKLFSDNEIYYLAFNGFFRDDLDFNIEIDKLIPHTKNVIVASLLIAIYMGFEEIYLLGVKHDFLAYPSYKHYENFKHFYKTNYTQSNKNDIEYFKLAVMSYEQHITSVLRLFKNYRLLKEKIAKMNPNIKIYNATPGSFLDVFPMIDFDKIKL